MAKTAYSIQMDFQRAKKQAEELERIEKDIRKVADHEMPDCMREISSNWKGDNARLYTVKGQSVSENIRKVADGLAKTAATLRTIAQNNYNAEKTALELAETRNYQ